jgi:peptide chain release factor
MDLPVDLSPSLLEKARELGIRGEDIEEQFVRGSGAGGQKINKTSSCVELKHVPTGTLVRCQQHREQSKNRSSAYKLLILKIEQQVKGKESKIEQEMFKVRKQKQRRSRKAKNKMLKEKHIRGDIKEARRKII